MITLGGFKIASLTGSKLLAGLTASIGGAYTFKDVKEELVKTYFSLKEKERKIYHLNQKNSYKKTSYIVKKKLKEKMKTIITPIKKFFNIIINKKYLIEKKSLSLVLIENMMLMKILK